MWARVRSLVRMMFRRDRWEDDLADELAFHVEERARHYAGAGGSHEEALRRARVEFGGVEACRERCREARGARWIDELSRNVVYAVRSVRKNPGFTAVAVLSLALGIGANLAVFNVLHRLVLAKLPVRDPDHIYQVNLVATPTKLYAMSYPRFELLRDNVKIFSSLFGWGGWTYELTVGDRTQQAQVAAVTGNYFETLGVRPALGRLLSPQDEQARATQIAVISYGLWQTVFGGDPGVVGRIVKLVDATFTVVGVTPPEFNGTEPGAVPAVYLPLHAYERVAPARAPTILQRPGVSWFHVMGRLAGDVPLATAHAVLREQWPRLEKAFPAQANLQSGRNTRYFMVLDEGGTGYSAVRQEFSQAILVLMGLVAAVFLIACANLATLLFVRGAGRLREISIRFALGASRAHLVRQWMTECLLLSVLGGVAGLIAARWITDLLLYFVAEADRPWLRFQAGPVVVLLGVALTLAAALLCGLVPALRATTARPEETLRAHTGAVTARRGFVAQAVLAGQLAASLVLVVGAALFSRTMWNLNSASGGFDRKAVVYANPDFAAAHIPREHQGGLLKEALDRLTRSPHIAAVSMGYPPMVLGDTGSNWVTGVAGYVLAPDEDNTAWINFAYPGYFNVMGIPLIEGRDFEERDRTAAGVRTKVIIINEKLARHYFADRNPVGERLTYGTPMEIIGVVKDTKNVSLRGAQRDLVYFPPSLVGASPVVARPAAGVAPRVVEGEMRAAFAAIAKGVPVEIAPLEDAVQRSLSRDRLVARLSAAFGILGILLASIGLYAAIAHSVSTRTREIGIRIAIGAKARDVIWMVLRESLRVTTIGVLIGLPAAIAGSRLIGSLLFEVSPSDPPTLAVSAAVLALTGASAGWWPARRAARLDPSSTLRCE
jgi:putative ABC transport system permease protein